MVVLEKQLGTHDPEATARKLEALYPATGDLMTWKPGESEQIAWESHQLAESDVYRALVIPERPCSLHSCDPATNSPVVMNFGIHGARRASCGAPTSEGGISPGVTDQSDLAGVVLIQCEVVMRFE